MSTEQFDPRSENHDNDAAVEDPLEELARIVSGEAETELEAPATDALPQEPAETSLEAYLMDELTAGQPEPEQPLPEQSEPEQPDDYAASIQEQLEAQLAAEIELETTELVSEVPEAPELTETEIEAPQLEEALAENIAPPEMVNEPMDVTTEAVDEETAFQDDLIEALQEEIIPPSPVMETAVPQPEAIVDLEEPFAEVSQEPLPQEMPIAEITEPEISAFEDQASEPTQPEMESAELDMPPPVVEEVAVENLQAEAEMSVSEPESEIDFGAAFAEELGIDAIEEAQGWEASGDTQQVDDFTLAAQSAGYQAVDDGAVTEPEYMNDQEAELAVANAGNDQASGGGMKYAMAALIIALFAGAITAGYGFLGGGSGDEQVAEQAAIIKADVEPVKVKPENPGGRIPDNQDKASYGKVEGIEEEVDQSTLLSNTEQPALIDTSNVTQEALEEAQSSLTAVDINSNKLDDRLSGTADTESTGVASNSSVAPKRVKTFVIKPDGTVVDQPATAQLGGSQQFATSSSDLGLTQVADAKPIAVSTTTVKPSKPIDGAQSSQAIGVPNASPLPKPEPVVIEPKPAPTQQVATTQTQTQAQTQQPVARSEWVVQVASQTSPEAAQTSFQRMRQQYSILQNRSMSVQRAAVNGRTYYRVRVQTASRSDANQLCSQLTSQGGSCFVTR